MNATIRWAKAHGFEVKILGQNWLLWRTAISTAELKDDHITWHSRDYFDTMKGEII